MPSTKGKPKNTELYEETKDGIKNETNKDGSGKGQWSAWKATKLAKAYEEAGGEYENEPGSKNEPNKGSPEPKAEAKKDEELKKEQSSGKETEQQKKDKVNKPKANSGKKSSSTKGGGKAKASKETDAPAPGSRKSARLGNKRSAPEPERDNAGEDEAGEDNSAEEKAPKKKKTAKK
ncbi:hypothetical protein MMC07_008212 [Pseudocyphellaria aurata]|nr:hypothetical protein [Pseudocyphellaria aurata]